MVNLLFGHVLSLVLALKHVSVHFQKHSQMFASLIDQHWLAISIDVFSFI